MAQAAQLLMSLGGHCVRTEAIPNQQFLDWWQMPGPAQGHPSRGHVIVQSLVHKDECGFFVELPGTDAELPNLLRHWIQTGGIT